MDTDTFIITIFTEDFLRILVMMLKDGLIHPTIIRMLKDHFQWVKIRDCKHMIELQHIHMEQMLIRYVKMK